MKKWLKNSGPATIIAAAFIGPGTVTVCSFAGVKFSFTLLWVMLIAIFATIILQQMSVRIGLVTQHGLADVLRTQLSHKFTKIAVLTLVLIAIVLGNSAYEAGNISGSVIGLEMIFGNQTIELQYFTLNLYSLLIGLLIFIFLFFGSYKSIEKLFFGLVITMSISFFLAAIITQPNVIELLKGLLVPTINQKNIITILALVGTTIVPYNLFLHSNLVNEKWNSIHDLKTAKKDTIIAIVIGGIVSISIIIASASVQNNGDFQITDLSKSLAPLYGNFATYLLGIGLFAAGITSAIAAPLAAAYVCKGCLGWEVSFDSKKFKLIWMLVLFTGIFFSSIGIKPLDVIKFAQFANGLLLPIITLILLWLMNKKAVLGDFTNSRNQNLVGFVIVLFTIFLGAKGILQLFN